MRYIAKYDELALHQRDGVKRHKFYQGELIVGDPTTKTGPGNFIDTALNATEPGLELMPLNVTATDRDIVCGMGTLATTPIVEGLFYESPYIPVGETSVPAVAGLVYKVVSGVVTYKTVAYNIGEEFTSDGTVVVTTGSAGSTFAITLPPSLKERRMDNRAAMFREQHLYTGNEATGYHSWSALGGFQPKDDLSNWAVPTDVAVGSTTGFGYIE